MQFEVMKKSHKKGITVGVVVFILIAIVLIVHQSFAKYQVIQSIPIVSGTINYTYNPADFEVLAMYKNDGDTDTPIDNVPTSGYKLNTSKSYCEIISDDGSKIKLSDTSLEYKNGKVYFGVNKRGSKCYVYFDKISAYDYILSKVNVNSGTPDFSQVATTNEGVYKAQDESGNDSHYFRGAVENNYVSFAEKTWRIVRINGDGSIRIILNASIGTSQFNSSYNNNMYVGFKYTSGQLHGTSIESVILQKLYAWYSSDLVEYSSYIDINAGFCGKRTPNYGTGIGSSETKYLWINSFGYPVPNLSCPNEDFYTTIISNKGNKSLTYPIGLIRWDEVIMSGIKSSKGDVNCFLYRSYLWWTMTPMVYGGWGSGTKGAYIATVNGSSGTDASIATSNANVVPVINLKSDVTLIGAGTTSDPYVVQ